MEGISRIEALPFNSGFNNSAQVSIGRLTGRAECQGYPLCKDRGDQRRPSGGLGGKLGRIRPGDELNRVRGGALGDLCFWRQLAGNEDRYDRVEELDPLRVQWQ